MTHHTDPKVLPHPWIAHPSILAALWSVAGLLDAMTLLLERHALNIAYAATFSLLAWTAHCARHCFLAQERAVIAFRTLHATCEAALDELQARQRELDAITRHNVGPFRIWSQFHRAWWGPAELGYTTDVDEAGLYGPADAARITLASAYRGLGLASYPVAAVRYPAGDDRTRLLPTLPPEDRRE